jgi:hypothetical protein
MAKRKSRFPSYGLVRGASHAQGGVAGVVAGEQPVELEGGEWIIPKEAVPDYLPVLKQITNEGRAMQEMQNGNTAMDALIASASMQNGITQPKSPMYQTGGVVSDKSWLEDILTDERGFFRGEQPEGTIRRGGVDWRTGTTRKLGEDPYQISVPEAVVSAKGFRAPDFKGETKRFHGAIGMINDMMLKRGLKKEAANLRRELNPYGLAGEAQVRVKTPDGSSGYALEATLPHAETERLYATPGERYDLAIHDYLSDTRNLAPLAAAEGLIKKRQSQPSNIVELLGGLFKGKEQQQGGPINQYQQGGQIQPRKQQEIRDAYIDPQDSSIVTASPYQDMLFKEAQGTMSFLPGTPNEAMVNTILDVINRPQVYNMPSEEELRKSQFVGPPAPAGIDSVLKQIMMRDVNQSINPFSGDSLNFEEDSLRLLGKMKKSHMPTYGRKKMQQGGPVMYQQGGLVGEGQPLERRYGEAAGGESPGGYFPLASQAEPGALMGSIRSDRRIKPLQPDTYIQKIPLAKPFDESSLAHPFYQEEVEQVPKLSTAYLASFGMETPLSRKQGALLYRKGIAPQTLNPQVKGLINRALVQRLTNEDD